MKMVQSPCMPAVQQQHDLAGLQELRSLLVAHDALPASRGAAGASERRERRRVRGARREGGRRLGAAHAETERVARRGWGGNCSSPTLMLRTPRCCAGSVPRRRGPSGPGSWTGERGRRPSRPKRPTSTGGARPRGRPLRAACRPASPRRRRACPAATSPSGAGGLRAGGNPRSRRGRPAQGGRRPRRGRPA